MEDTTAFTDKGFHKSLLCCLVNPIIRCSECDWIVCGSCCKPYINDESTRKDLTEEQQTDSNRLCDMHYHRDGYPGDFVWVRAAGWDNI